MPAYTTSNSIAFILAGTNSDLFGRRIVLILGNAICCIGFIVTATARDPTHFTAGLGITGFGGGFCQMAMCSVPELMPNKFRHIGICISDGLVYVIVVIGPVIGRYAIDSGSRDWQYVYWSGFVLQFLTLIGVIWLYHPPKHPRGIPWSEAVKGLDYVGALLIVPGICLTLVGIINTTVSTASLNTGSIAWLTHFAVQIQQRCDRDRPSCQWFRLYHWLRPLGNIFERQIPLVPTVHLQVSQWSRIHCSLYSRLHCHHVLLWHQHHLPHHDQRLLRRT